MTKTTLLSPIALAAALFGAAGPATAQDAISDGVVRIGVLNDRSGLYADMAGEGSVEAARMAAEEFGGEVAGVPVEIVFADHQNKPDVGVSIARKWYDADGVDVIMDIGNSAVSLAVNELVKNNNKLVLHTSASAALSGEDCAPRSVQWQYSVFSAADKVVTQQMIDEGLDSFFIIAVDYALGDSIIETFTNSIERMGGEIVGVVRHPLNTPDMSSYLLQAQASGAKGIMLANAGTDLGTAVRQAMEFGVTPGVQLLAAALTTDVIDANGLDVMQGVQVLSQYNMYRNEEGRAWLEAFAERHGTTPSSLQAGTYSAALNYLKAVDATGTDDADTVLDWLKEQEINDAFASSGHILDNGLHSHDMYLARIKAPDQSEGPGDYFDVIEVLPGEVANVAPEDSGCPLVGN
ncbi:ABC transporter substrate-binding protein [Celeribacter indicus]|uniref:Putative branched-chain amino acid ABC transporter, periplasmic component n=1 Tax=Celeribacter indicus TaxID=1208324 RepID=A0A0B5EA46_9RHOB|nr:ABC transporter substrate-binding protein [Celeribacter indicus]AJE49157.1 putative branched-chain amino acid ABC transporter, periplasmic component [Celeribacter indicus]SDX17770.1 amino acid/amide ABC transporter substrate-binding protein, HAAT family [Celeribacter indicus]